MDYNLKIYTTNMKLYFPTAFSNGIQIRKN